MKKSILITGGLGYIGSCLAKNLSRQSEYNVTLSSRKLVSLPQELENCSLVQVDVNTSINELTQILKSIDVVIHLAALNEIDCLEKPDEAILINVLGLQKILSASIQAGVKKFIYFSTAHVYCSPLSGKISENIYPLPQHPYAITHRAAEDYVIAATLQSKINGIIVRLSNSIGAPIHPGVNRWTLLVNDICKQIAESKEIRLKTSGVQLRNFITMNDLCRAINHFCTIKEIDKKFPVYNLGGPSNMSISEMVNIVVNVCKKEYGFTPSVFKPELLEKSFDLNYDSSKLKKTGFYWVNDIEKEIKDTLKVAFHFFNK
jgi:UDP-glucose 4-epimerase